MLQNALPYHRNMVVIWLGKKQKQMNIHIPRLTEVVDTELLAFINTFVSSHFHSLGIQLATA